MIFYHFKIKKQEKKYIGFISIIFFFLSLYEVNDQINFWWSCGTELVTLKKQTQNQISSVILIGIGNRTGN